MADTGTNPQPAPIEAYLSSSRSHERGIARRALAGCVIREGPNNIDAVEQHLTEIARSHLYVGIVGWTLGPVPGGSSASLQELEYERAQACGLMRLAFIEGPDSRSASGSDLERVVAFRRHILASADRAVVFTNDSELDDKLSRAIAELRSVRVSSPILKGDDIQVFVSYRRSDSEAITGRLCDRLKQEFGSDRVFVDIDNIPLGDDFVAHIRATLRRCQVVLAVIGPKWRGRRGAGTTRLDDVNDFVRMELGIALAGSTRVLPVLVDGSRMPNVADLPEELRTLCTLNAAPLSAGKDFHHHAAAIVAALRRMSAENSERRFWTEAGAAASSGRRAPTEGFKLEFLSSEVEYQCASCGFTDWIHKLEWGRDGERPPAQCPKCRGQGYRG